MAERAESAAPRGGPGGANFASGSIPRHVIRLSGFMVMGFLAMTIAQLIEAVYLGLVGTDELAAVAFTFPIVLALGAMTRGIGVGAGAVIARAVGEGDRDRASRLTTHALGLVALFTLIASVFLALNSAPLFALLGAEGAILDLVTSYVAVWAWGFPLFGLAMVGSGLMRSLGDPAFPGIVMTTGAVLQVIIGPFLIFGWVGLPAMGLEGAALAFVLARSLGFVMTIYWFFVREKVVRLSFSGLADSLRAILHVGIPAMATNLIAPLSTAITIRLLAEFPSSVVAGFGVASRIEAVVAMVVIGISASTGPMVGQNWGAKRFDRVFESLKVCYQFSLAWGLIAAVIMWVGGAFFLSLITDDAALIEAGTLFLYIVPISLGFMGMVNVANGAFNALSKPMPPLVLSILRLVVVYIPMALAFAAWWGYVGIYIATALANVILGVIGWRWNKHTLTRAMHAIA